MKLRLWGTRGSIPAPGPSTVRYGGNTSCVEVRLQDGTLIILDAGSGIRPLGAALGPCEATLLLSHYHYDHIQGLPFFGSAYCSDSNIHVVGPEFNGEGPEEYLGGQMVTPYFPAPPSQLRGLKSFEVTPAEPFRVARATVCAGRMCHPGITFGYRIEEGSCALVYMSDDEVDLAGPEALAGIIDLAAGADLLIHDCQYSEGEYPSHRGWGHSTPRQAVMIAAAAGVRRLMLFHHDPSHSDEQLEALAEEAAALGGGIEIIIGREGESLTVGKAGVARSSARTPMDTRAAQRHSA